MRTRQSVKYENQLFEFLHAGANPKELSKLAKKDHVSKHRLEELIDGHYYLSPGNLVWAQPRLGFLVIILCLTLTAVRENSSWFYILLSLGIGAILSLPYVFFFLMGKSNKDLKKLSMLMKMSLVYTIFLAVFFIVIAFNSGLFGAILIPSILLFFYMQEVAKLEKLIKKLKTLNAESESH